MHSFNAHTHDLTSNRKYSVLQTDGVALERWNSVGIHPWTAELYTIDSVVSQFERLRTDQTIAVGEVGVDAWRGGDLEHQYQLFVAHAQLAEELNLPVIIHCVRAWEWILKACREVQPQQKWIYHGFNKKNLLKQVLDCPHMMISIGELGKQLDLTWIKDIPDDRLLLETDTANVDINSIYEMISITKAISLQDLQKQIHTNFTNTFTKWHIG